MSFSSHSLSRRFVLSAGSAFLVSAAFQNSLFAAPIDGSFGSQAEWGLTYNSGTRDERSVRSESPILSSATVQATEVMIQRYQDLAARGGWRQLTPGRTLKVGSQGPTVVALRERLIVTGDLDQELAASPSFDSFVEAAVKRFQERHGLGPTGVVGKQTYAAFNEPIETRLKQLEINLVRLRTYSGNLGQRFVTANIPAAYVETVENGQVQTRHAAGVGKVDRQSPIMMAKILDVNFNPFWTVPASIIKKDLIPKMQKDPTYLDENKIRIISADGHQLQASQVNWNSDEATRYKFRQDPGGEYNSLGFVRINIANPHGVYMHDTPAKGIFGDDFRFVSSGCIRVQNVRDYIAWILKDNPQWNRQTIDEAIRSGQRIDAKPAAAIPVYWVYITAWATPEGVVQFRDDIYGKDGFGPGAVTKALQAADDE